MSTDTAPQIWQDQQQLAALMRSTKEAQDPDDVGAQIVALDALYRRLQDEADPLDGPAVLDAWMRAGRLNTLVDRLCEVMHDAYEEAAAGNGWVTQEASRKPWADVPEANKATMRVAVTAMLQELERRAVEAA